NFSDISDLLDQHFERLSVDEKSLVFWLAVERETIGIEQISNNLTQKTNLGDLYELLSSLHGRAIIEGSAIEGFHLQPVIREYTTDTFVNEMAKEILNVPRTLSLFNSHALMKAQSSEHIRASQVRLIIQPILSVLQQNDFPPISLREVLLETVRERF